MTSSYQLPTIPQLRISSEERDAFNNNFITAKEDKVGRGGFALLDFGGRFGDKQRVIDEIVSDSSTKYTPGQGYKLNWLQKNLYNITDQDVYNARRTKEVDALRTKYDEAAEEYGIKIDGTSTSTGLRKKIKDAKEIETLTTELSGIQRGDNFLKELKANGPVTADGLRSKITEARGDTDDARLTKNTLQEQINASKDNRRRLDEQQDFNEAQLKWQQQTQAEQDRRYYENKRDQLKDRALQRQLTAQTNQMQLGFQYAQLAQQDRNRREDRKEKALLAILGGMKNLGEAFLI